MPDRARGTPDTSRSRLRDGASPAPPGVVSTGPPDPDSDPASPAAPEELGALASPTLAALYASQGHGEMAAAIYAQLVRQGSCPSQGSPDLKGASRPAAADLVERLLALRQAARRRRATPEAKPTRRETEEPADGG